MGKQIIQYSTIIVLLSQVFLFEVIAQNKNDSISFRPKEVNIVESDSTNDKDYLKNVIYLELLGAGFPYSLNYERLVTSDLSFRIGFNYTPGNGFIRYYKSIPILVNYFIGEGNSKLELGIGIGFTSDDILGLSSIGYRYLSEKNGHFRVVFNPIIHKRGVIPLIGISYGGSF